MDCVDALLDLLADSRTDFGVKLMDYAKVGEGVFEFCRFYARWLGNPLMEGLTYERMRSMSCWRRPCAGGGGQEVYDGMGV